MYAKMTGGDEDESGSCFRSVRAPRGGERRVSGLDVPFNSCYVKERVIAHATRQELGNK